MTTDAAKLAWAAGLFEGEGCVTLTKRRAPQSPTAVAVLTSTDLDVVESFRTAVGLGSIRALKQRQSHHKQAWEWRIQSFHNVNKLFQLLAPWLHERRTKRFKWVLAECAQGAAHNRPFKCVETGEIFHSQQQAADKLGIKHYQISSVLTGRLKSAHKKQYHFCYV